MEKIDRNKIREFEQRRGCRVCPEGIFAEMSMRLGAYREKTAPIPGVTFEFYRGGLEDLQAAVRQVDEEWVQYFTGESPVFCGFRDGKIASFCIVEEDTGCMIAAPAIRVGSIGCVGTVPEFRSRGIGLRMVDLATVHLQKEGFHRAYIGYTHIDRWYAQLGYRTFARFSFREA